MGIAGILVGFSHAVYIDESGAGAPVNHINRLWVTVGLAIPFGRMPMLNLGVKMVLTTHFNARVAELKGSLIPDELKPSTTSTDVAAAVSQLARTLGVHAWVTVSRSGRRPPQNLRIPRALPKDVTRQFLFERINGFLNLGHYSPNRWLLIWDISDQQELNAFSHDVAVFQNVFGGSRLNPRLTPAILGGLSHDWKGLQLADIIANFALHNVGNSLSLPGSNATKSRNFDTHFRPLLQRAQSGSLVGWKLWI
jgi:hypothetical protein